MDGWSKRPVLNGIKEHNAGIVQLHTVGALHEEPSTGLRSISLMWRVTPGWVIPVLHTRKLHHNIRFR